MKITLTLLRNPYAREIWKKKRSLPTLSLLILAAFTPDDVEVGFIDDKYEEIRYRNRIDLVGITAITEIITRAYEIADEYRRCNTPVVLGGIHPSLLPDEASDHTDCVVIGDADEI
jgi:radical SAM superfamily enzyme YgiQ (UPF0313 family)